MALLFMEGFDWSSTGSELSKRWSNNGVDAVNEGRGGNNAVVMDRQTAGSQGGYLWKVLPSSGDTIIVGAAVYVNGNSTGGLSSQMIGIGEGTTVAHSAIAIDGNGYIIFKVGDVTVYTSNERCPVGEWHYLELKAKIHSSTGYAIVRKNEKEIINLTNINTRNGGTGTPNSIFLHVAWNLFNNDTFRADDIYVCDTTGSNNNSFLGDVSVKLLRPTEDSTPLTWTPSTGTSHFEMINDNPYSAADYITGTTNIGDRDTFGLEDLTSTPAIIYGIGLTTIADKTDSGDASLKHFVTSSSQEFLSSATTLSFGSTNTLNDIIETDPNTGSLWTKANLNNAKVGVQVA